MKNITLKSVLAWILGIIFLLLGVALLFTDFLTGIIFILCAGLTLPPAMNIFKEKSGFGLSGGLRFVAVIILIGISIGISSTKNNDQTRAFQSSQIAPVEQVVATTSTSTQPVASAQPITTTSPITPKPQTPAIPSFSGDGNYIVGTDIQPGTYRTRVGSGACYYARLKGFSGSSNDIIANANTDAPAVITISASDAGFQSSGCGTWTKDLSEITSNQTNFGDGIFIVGTDILPGTYRSTGGDECYYARLKNFGGTSDDIAANENTDTSAIITIASIDAGFQSSGCGTWTKIQ